MVGGNTARRIGRCLAGQRTAFAAPAVVGLSVFIGRLAKPKSRLFTYLIAIAVATLGFTIYRNVGI